MSVIVFPFLSLLGRIGFQDCENHTFDGCAACRSRSQGSLSPQPPALAKNKLWPVLKLGRAAPSSPPCQPGGRLVASSLPLSSLNNITSSRSLFPRSHLTFTSPNLPFKAYLHTHVILTTVQWPGLFSFWSSCRVVQTCATSNCH